MARPRSVEDNELLDAAMTAFWADGYGGVSTRALEQATGLPASSLYHRYGSKEGLFVAVLAHYIDRVIAGRAQRYLAADDAAAGLRAFFTSVYRQGGRPYRACLLANTWQELHTRLPAVTTELARGRQLLLAAFAANLRRGIDSGAWRAGLDVAVAADFLFLSLQGLLAAARGERDPARLDAQVDFMLGALR